MSPTVVHFTELMLQTCETHHYSFGQLWMLLCSVCYKLAKSIVGGLCAGIRLKPPDLKDNRPVDVGDEEIVLQRIQELHDQYHF